MHCDDFAADYQRDAAARWFVFINRLPVSLRQLVRVRGLPDPVLFADYQGKRVRVVMASRLGDVGITDDLTATNGYKCRVGIDELSNFGEQP